MRLMPTLAAAVDLAALWKIALAAVLAGTGGVVAVVMAIAGLDRAEHASGPGAAARRAGGIALTALGIAMLAAGVLAGLVAMTHK